MTLARPLADDPVLLGRQQRDRGAEGRRLRRRREARSAPARRSRPAARSRTAPPPRRASARWSSPRAGCSASGATSSPHGAPGRGLPPLAPNVEVLVARRPAARSPGRSAPSTARSATAPGVVLAPNSAARPLPGRAADDPLAPAGRRRGAALRQPRHRRPPGARAGPLRRRRRLLAADRHAARQERRAPRRARRARRRRRGDDPRAAQHARGRRPARRDQRAPAARQLRPAPRARHPPGHGGLDARRAPRRAARDRPRPGAGRAARRDPPRRPRGLPAAARACCASSRRSSPAATLYRDALAELSRAQGVVLGNVGVFVDASVDPETLTHSAPHSRRRSSAQGLVAEAMRGGGDGLPLLRGITAQTIAGVAGEEQVLVFAERVRCLRQLAAHAARAPRRRGARRRRLGRRAPSSRRSSSASAPASSRSCASSQVGHEGHNLQNASVHRPPRPAVAADRPRAARRTRRPPRLTRAAACRPTSPTSAAAGSSTSSACSPPRGAEHHQILDSFEGVQAADSTIATQLGAITGQVAAAKDDAGYAATAARLRVAAAVFGA